MEQPTKRPARVAKISRWMAGLALASTVALPIATVVFVLVSPEQVIARDGLAKIGITTLDRTAQIIVAANDLIFSLPIVWGLFQLRGLFRCYAAGEVFSQAASRYLSRFAFALLLDAIATILSRSTEALMLTIGRPEGQRILTFGVSSDDFGSAFIGMTFLIVAWVMAEATTMAEEHREFL